MAKTFKAYLKEISDQQMKDMSAGNAYNGGGANPTKANKKPKQKRSQADKDAGVARMNAEDEKKKAEQRDRFAAIKKSADKKNESFNEGDDRIIFKGKEIDTDTIEYDMQDFSDMIAPIEYAKYTDGTEVDDGDLEDLDELPAMQNWISTDYMDRRADQADMYRDAQKHGDFESTELDRIKELAGASIDETYDDDDAFYEAYGELWYNEDEIIDEAEYQGRKVKLGKPMQGDVKKFKVYVKDPKTGNVKKVNFGHGGSSVKGKAMSIKKNNPKRRKSFRARHNCDNPGPRTKARYWSCRKW